MGFRFFRFYSDENQNLELPWEKNDPKRRIHLPLPVFKVGTAPLAKLDAGVGDKTKINYGNPDLGRSKIFVESSGPFFKRILNPESETILRWNRVFLFSCLTALFVDPLFFYLPSVIHHHRSSCMTTDFNLGIVVTVFRTFADVFYLFHMVLKFRMAYVSPISRVFGKGELVTDPKMIAKRYLKSDFFIDLIASLPLPQVLNNTHSHICLSPVLLNSSCFKLCFKAVYLFSVNYVNGSFISWTITCLRLLPINCLAFCFGLSQYDWLWVWDLQFLSCRPRFVCELYGSSDAIFFYIFYTLIPVI